MNHTDAEQKNDIHQLLLYKTSGKLCALFVAICIDVVILPFLEDAVVVVVVVLVVVVVQ